MAPGSVVTGIGGGRMADPAVRARYAKANPLNRMASPNELMGLALYLASPASSYVTGAQLAIDGGGSAGMAGMTDRAMKAEEIFSVRDRVAVVTGGANGLGFAYARALADNGARVTIFDIDSKAAESAATELSARGGRVRCAAVDLTDAKGLKCAFDEVVEIDGGLDVVFANAGVTAGPGFLDAPRRAHRRAGAIENIPADLWGRVVDINLTGVFLTIQAATPHLKARGSGRIIVTTSTAASKTSPAVGTAYVATKAAIAHLVRQVAVELAKFNILVNAIQPGPFQTRITTPELLPVFEQSSPSHRVGLPEEIEGLALFFASDASSFVTGAQYNIDGGQLLGRAD